jgi:hypothetical protein
MNSVLELPTLDRSPEEAAADVLLEARLREVEEARAEKSQRLRVARDSRSLFPSYDI